jgi:hypothetical protein
VGYDNTTALRTGAEDIAKTRNQVFSATKCSTVIMVTLSPDEIYCAANMVIRVISVSEGFG